MEKYKTKFILTSVVCLLPLILSVILYDQLPQQVAVHWDQAGVANNYVPKALAAFGLPFFCLGIHCISFFMRRQDPKAANTSAAIGKFIDWLIPLMSLILLPVTLFIAIGVEIPIPLLVSVMVGGIFIVVGNYLPKSRQNYTIGIRLPWTLTDPDNWNKTHRLAGYLWIIGGFVMIVIAFMATKLRPSVGVPLVLLLVLLLSGIPAIYSYVMYHRKR